MTSQALRALATSGPWSGGWDGHERAGGPATNVYSSPAVRRRIGEFLGGPLTTQSTAVYFDVGTLDAASHRSHLPLEDLPSWFGEEVELHRSLWDRGSLLLHLDIEYLNFDDAAAPYRAARRAFRLQESVLGELFRLLDRFGIHPLVLMTGRGFHCVWRVDSGSLAFLKLASLGRPGASLQKLYSEQAATTGETVNHKMASAYAGAGLVMEYLAGRVKYHAARSCEVPVELGAIEVGPGSHGREMISIDITEYADPLCSRVIRIPYTPYLKAHQQRVFGTTSPGDIFPIYTIPVTGLTTEEALLIRHSSGSTAKLAAHSAAIIPNEILGTEALIAAYNASPLGEFHQEFYAESHVSRSLWPKTYGSLPLDRLPPCGRFMLEHANDVLLRPSCVGGFVRILLSLGWHPRHIAGFIRSHYESEHGWNDTWNGFDPATRADFYARVFSGLFVTGVDDLVAFNCKSAQEQGLCFNSQCTDNLAHYRASLLNRRSYERLARRPFNRMFLPEQHL